MNKNKAVFLDRDGILIEDTGFPGAVGEIQIIRQSISAVRQFNELGYLVIVVTNQSAVARGFIDEAGVDKINSDISKQFQAGGAIIDRFYYCPHLPDGTVKKYAVQCNCRKPEPGMIFQALKELNIDNKRSFLIGDSKRDIEAAKAAGVEAIQVKNLVLRKEPHNVCRSIIEATSYIVGKTGTKQNVR